MSSPARRTAAGVLLLVLAAALAAYIFTNDDRDRVGAVLVAGLLLGGVRLLRWGR